MHTVVQEMTPEACRKAEIMIENWLFRAENASYRDEKIKYISMAYGGLMLWCELSPDAEKSHLYRTLVRSGLWRPED